MAENSSKKKGLGRGLSHLFGEAQAAYSASAPVSPASDAATPATGGGSILPIAHLKPGRFQPRRHFDETALEEAEGYKRLMDEFGHTHGKLGDLVGKSRSHVANTLRLLALPDAVKAMMQSGDLSAGHARAILNVPAPEALAEVIVERNLSVRAAEQLAEKAKAEAHAAPPKVRASLAKRPAKHADLLALERDMTERLGLRVTIEGKGATGVLSIAYQSIDQLDGILEKLSKQS